MAVLAVVVAFCVLNPASALATTVLTPVPGSPFATSTAPGTVVFSPSGKLLAIDTGAANSPIAVLSVGPDGALTQVPGSPFPAGTGGEFGGPAMAFNPSGSLLAIGNVDGDTVSVYSVSAAGALTQAPGSPFEDLIDPVSVAFSPSGSLLATADTNGDFTLWAFSVAADGTLAPVPGSPFSTGNTEVSVAFSPSGSLLATIEPFNDSVSVYSVGSDGSLTELSTYPLSLPSGDNPLSVAFSPSGAFLVVTDNTHNEGPGFLSVLSVGASGALTQVPGSPFPGVVDPDELSFTASGALFVTGGSIDDTQLAEFSLGPGGELTQVAGSPFALDFGAAGVAVNPSGTLVAATNPTNGINVPPNTVSVFSFGSGVVAVAPSLTGAPLLTGKTKPGDVLSCSTGSWTGNSTSYAYAWYRNGTLLAGFAGSTYKLGTLDEGTTFTCVVTASNAAGQASATSNAVKIPIPVVQHCPGATGSMTGTTIGQITLGMTQSRARYLYRQHSNHGKQYEDFFCLTPIGVRVGYASPILLKSVREQARPRLRGRVVWASTSNPYYSLDGVRAGESIATAARALDTEAPFHIGLNYWYLARKPGYTAVLKVRGSVVQELGIADNSLTTTRKTQNVLMHSFY